MESVQRVLRTVGVDAPIPLHSTAEDALTSCNNPPGDPGRSGRIPHVLTILRQPPGEAGKRRERVTRPRGATTPEGRRSRSVEKPAAWRGARLRVSCARSDAFLAS